LHRARSHTIADDVSGREELTKKFLQTKSDFFDQNFFSLHFPSRRRHRCSSSARACVCVCVYVLVENCRRRAFVRGGPLSRKETRPTTTTLHTAALPRRSRRPSSSPLSTVAQRGRAALTIVPATHKHSPPAGRPVRRRPAIRSPRRRVHTVCGPAFRRSEMPLSSDRLCVHRYAQPKPDSSL